MAYRLTCATCGFSGIYKHLAHGHYSIGRHRCTRHRSNLARAKRVRARLARRALGRVATCQHKVADHQHGTYAMYVLDRCRCVPCADANASYEAWRTREKLFGRWDQRWADAGPVRERLLELADQRVNYKQVCHVTGLNPSTIGAIIYGRHDRRGGGPPARVKREIADTIMGLVIDPLQFTDGHVIDSVGFRRRAQALVAVGYSLSRIADELGIERSNFGLMIERPGITVRHMRAMIELYDRWWDTDPLAGLADPATKRGVTMARRMAAKQGWPRPMDWPDDAIDDPNYRPDVDGEEFVDEIAVDLACRGERGVRLSPAERQMAVDQLTEKGVSAKEISRLLGTTSRTVVRIRHPQRKENAWAS